jgi:hypothetical protein
MDLALGLSLGMYYTVTYYGRALLPLPGFVAMGAPFEYYLIVGEVQDTVAQAWLWMSCFPAVGLMWRGALWAVAKLGRVTVTSRAIVAGMWHCSWPLLVPAPFLLLALGSGDDGFSWHALTDACLRRRSMASPVMLPAVYFVAAVAALAQEARGIWRLGGKASTARRVVLLAGAPIVLLLAVSAIGLVWGALVD